MGKTGVEADGWDEDDDSTLKSGSFLNHNNP